MPRVAKASKSSASTANFGFEATAMRDSAKLPREGTPQSLSAAKDNRWLSVPPPVIARRFDELTAPLMVKIKANPNDFRTLAALRDTLLQRCCRSC